MMDLTVQSQRPTLISVVRCPRDGGLSMMGKEEDERGQREVSAVWERAERASGRRQPLLFETGGGLSCVVRRRDSKASPADN